MNQTGKANRVSGSIDVTRSAPVLTGILKGGSVSMLGGIFNIGGVSIRSDIQTSGRVHVRVGQDLRHFHPVERMATALQFVQLLCSLYERWVNNEVENKYPPEDFFLETHDNLRESGVDVEFSIQRTLTSYQQKREGEFHE